MSQVRLVASAGGRVLEGSKAARQFSSYQRRHLQTRICAHRNAGSLNSLQRPNLSREEYQVAWTTIPNFRIARSLSSNTPETSTSTKSTEPPPPPPAPSKKAKVELRPGPTKTSSHAGSTKAASVAATPHHDKVKSQVHSDTKPHPTKPPPLAASCPKEARLKEEEGKRLVDIARKDVDEAARHGILAPPPPDVGKVGKLWHQAKELFKFYVAGLKYIYVNRKEVSRIHERVKNGGAPISWREHRFILMNRSDLVKLAPFLVILLLVEELIPLIVLYVPGMLPSTCVLPSQRERIEARRHERQRGAYALAKSMNAFNDISIEEAALSTLDSGDVSLLCSTAGLSSWGPLALQRSRLGSYLRKVAVEDELLLREGQGAKLKRPEIATALTDRGFLADSYTPAQQRDRLRWWLENVRLVESNAQKSPEDVRAQLLVLMLREASL